MKASKHAIRTIARKEITNSAMIAGNEMKITRIILDGTVRAWVAIGWVDEGPPTLAQQRTLPHVID